MDRRRPLKYVPSADGLESRQLMAATLGTPIGVTAPPGVQVEGSAPTQQTIEAKRQHIQNLPFFIGLLNRDGAVPQPTVQNIQDDLYPLVAQLHQGDSHLAANFNLDLRKAQPYLTIRSQDATALNRDFGAVLVSTGANPAIVADLQNQMTDLVNFDTTQRNSMIDATNDYATVLQLAVGSGRPLVYPNVPGLLAADHNGNVGKVAVTHKAQPTLTGNYITGTNVQIVDADNQTVLGTAAVDSTGVYKVQFAAPLVDGTYTVRVRAEDAGFVSDPSPKFSFIVKLPTPKVKAG